MHLFGIGKLVRPKPVVALVPAKPGQLPFGIPAGFLPNPLARLLKRFFPIKIQTTDNRCVNLNEFRVGLEWKFYKSYEPERITVKDKKLTFKANGTDLRTSPPILFVAGQHAYEVETRIEIEGDVTAGIVLYYNDRFFMGTAFNKERRVRYRKGEERGSGNHKHPVTSLSLSLSGDR